MSSEAAGLRTVTFPPVALERYDAAALLGFLATRAVTGVEQATAGTYQRVLPVSLGGGTLRVRFEPAGTRTTATVHVTAPSPAVAEAAGAAARHLFDLDGDGDAVHAALGADRWLGPLLARRPGLRVPGAVDPDEIVVRAIVGQQVSVPAARTVLNGLAERYGEPHDGGGAEGGAEDGRGDEGDAALHRRFPTASRLAALEPADLPMPRARGACLIGACRALADGALRFTDDAGRPLEPAELRAQLLRLRGVGPWTADYIVLRTTTDRDVFLAGDLAVRRAAGRLGMADDQAGLARLARRWRPWRAYAVLHLWASLADDVPPPTGAVDRS
ncbi:MAG: AlkA N-terminal domain-containing protein [Acidimicrobiales bacterium]